MTVWTISKYQQWVQCGLQYALEHAPEKVIDRFKGWRIERLPAREKGPALQRGIDIHEGIDAWLRGDLPELPPAARDWEFELSLLQQAIAEAKSGGTEIMWSFDDEWYPIERGATVWHRQKLDAWFVRDDEATVIDFKTGKFYPKNKEQMEVYALGALAKFDGVQRVTTELWYLDQPRAPVTDDPFPAQPPNPLPKVFERDEATKLARRWEKRAANFINDTQFVANKGFQCNWCPYSKRKGGPCPH